MKLDSVTDHPESGHCYVWELPSGARYRTDPNGRHRFRETDDELDIVAPAPKATK